METSKSSGFQKYAKGHRVEFALDLNKGKKKSSVSYENERYQIGTTFGPSPLSSGLGPNVSRTGPLFGRSWAHSKCLIGNRKAEIAVTHL